MVTIISKSNVFSVSQTSSLISGVALIAKSFASGINGMLGVSQIGITEYIKIFRLSFEVRDL